MKFISKRYCLKIPSEILVLYNEKKKIILISNGLKKIIFNLKVKLKILKKKKIIIVTERPFFKASNNLKKKKKSLQGATYFSLQKLFKNIQTVSCKKLKLIGVGYKVFKIKNKKFDYKLLQFKLGYSHNIYYKISNNVNIKTRQSNKLFILGYDYDLVSKISAIIRNYKYPEPYKGKGILFFNEFIKLKEGKKL